MSRKTAADKAPARRSERNKRLAAALRANLKRRKAAGKAADRGGAGARDDAPKQS